MSVPISYYLNSPELRPDVSPSSPIKSTSRTPRGIDISLLPLIPTHDDITDLKTYLHGDKESKLQSRLRRREMRRQLRAQTNDEALRQPGHPRHRAPNTYAPGSGSDYIPRYESSFYAGQPHSFSMPSLVRTGTASPQPLSRALTPTPQVVSVDPQRSASKQYAPSTSEGFMGRMSRSRSASTLSFRKWRVKNKSTPNVNSQPLDSRPNSPVWGPRVHSPMFMANREYMGPDTSISTAPSVNSFDLSLSPTSSHQLSSVMDQRNLVSPLQGGEIASDSFSSLLVSDCDTPHIPPSHSYVPFKDNTFSPRRSTEETDPLYPRGTEHSSVNKSWSLEKQPDATSDLHVRKDVTWLHDASADGSTTDSLPLPTSDPTTSCHVSSQPSYDTQEVFDLPKKSQGMSPPPTLRVVKLDQVAPLPSSVPEDSSTQNVSETPSRLRTKLDVSKPLPELETGTLASETDAWPYESDKDASIATAEVEEVHVDGVEALTTPASNNSGVQAHPRLKPTLDPLVSIYSGVSSQSSPDNSLSLASNLSDSNHTVGRKDSVEATTQCAPEGIDDMLLAALNIASETPSTSLPVTFAPFDRDMSPASPKELSDSASHGPPDSWNRAHAASSWDDPTNKMAPHVEEFQAQQASLRGTIETSKAEILQLREKIQAFRVEVGGDCGSLNGSPLDLNMSSLSSTQKRRLRDSLASMDNLDQRLSEMLQHHDSVN